MKQETKRPGIVDALIPIIGLVIMLVLALNLFDDPAGGANQIALILAAALAVTVGLKNGLSWATIESGIGKGIAVALSAILILLTIGMLIGAWVLSGTVPALIYYGLELLDPSWFYAATCFISAVIAISVGSSWTAAGTVGVAFIGIASGMGLSLPITAGAIISGAYFGDKLSPLSDTTNLASAVTGVDLFDHIRHMLWTSVPSFIIALSVFFVLGLNNDVAMNEARIDEIASGILSLFDVSVWALLPLVVLISLAVKRVPAMPTIFIGALAGVVIAATLQQDAINQIFASSEHQGALRVLLAIWTALFDGVSLNTGNQAVDDLLSRGGMSSMLGTIWLILCAMTFGAAMEAAGLLRRLVESLLAAVKSTGSLIAATLATCIGTNLVTADQYISIVMPGRMFKDAYQDKGLARLNLSRSLEDAGTITSPLIFWNSCGVYMGGVLGVSAIDYAYYAVFNWTSPLLALLFAYTGYTIKYTRKPA